MLSFGNQVPIVIEEAGEFDFVPRAALVFLDALLEASALVVIPEGEALRAISHDGRGDLHESVFAIPGIIELAVEGEVAIGVMGGFEGRAVVNLRILIQLIGDVFGEVAVFGEGDAVADIVEVIGKVEADE